MTTNLATATWPLVPFVERTRSSGMMARAQCFRPIVCRIHRQGKGDTHAPAHVLNAARPARSRHELRGVGSVLSAGAGTGATGGRRDRPISDNCHLGADG